MWESFEKVYARKRIHMETAQYNVFAEKCFRDTPPPCAAVCPLDIDVREFIRLMRKGSVRSAYKVIQRSLIFPSVVTEICPEMCKDSCVRGHLGDESIDLKSLEKICVEKMAGKKPERYNIPPKKKTAAVIGAGLSGLACAYRLASFGYAVTVYDRNSLVGGLLPENVDRQWAHDEIMREFSAVRCTFVLNTEITSLEAIEADAFYIATGAGGSAFRDRADNGCRGMLLRGGRLTGAALMEAMRMGLTAAERINNELLTDRASDHIEEDMAVPFRQADPRYYELHYDTAIPAEIPAKGEAEAFRCMRCNCSECYDVCPLMEKHRQYPKKICNEIIVTLKPNKSRRTAVRLIMGCTECGACREACPEQIDMGKCLQEARTDFYESGAMSPAFHDYWLCDMEFSESDKVRLLQVRDETRPADILYFPGCQLPASMPELAARSYEALEQAGSNPAVLLGCCGVPAKWAGRKDRYRSIRSQLIADWESLGRPLLVTACPSCLENLKSLHPDLQVISYYHYAALHPELLKISGTDTAGKLRVKVIDPCSSTAESGMAEDVRHLLDLAGYEIINREPDPACCGFGGHIYNAVPALHDTFAARRFDPAEDPDMIAASYCANCRDILACRGADARHVLGMLLDVHEEHRRPPELSERRSNRLAARNYLEKAGHADDADVPSKALTDETGSKEMTILIPEKLIDKMDRGLILRDQVNDLICEAEETGGKIYDEGDNNFIAHRRFGTVTIWAVYSYTNADTAPDASDAADDPAVPVQAAADTAGTAILVENVYWHRMEIREDQA